MPLTEFKCPQCAAVTEAILTAEEKSKKKIVCPKCKIRMDLIPISQPAKFQWGKGGGWD